MQHSDFLPASRPILADLASCDHWLAREQLTDAERACAAFIGLLGQLEQAPPAVPVCTQILERLRTPMHAALDENSRRYAGRPLPLGSVEAAAFAQGQKLWLAQIRAWRRLLRAGRNRPDLAADRSRLAIRTLESVAGLMAARFAAHRHIAPEHWHWLNQAFAFAEKENLAEIEVRAEHAAESLTCTAIYAWLLLVQLSNPAALSQREYEWTRRWASRWARKVRLWRSAANGGGLAVDLDSGKGAEWSAAGTPGAAMRFIDFAEVRRSIRSRIKRLDAGSAPEELGLGKDCPPIAAKALLNVLLQCWSDAPKTRQFPRRTTVGNAELIASFAGIHREIAGPASEDENSPWDYKRHEAEQIHPFQRAAKAPASQNAHTSVERWEMLDESANGFRLRRDLGGNRLAHRQLVALRPQGASQYILCDVRWLSQGGERLDGTRAENSIMMGAKAMPGLPQACALRPVGITANGGAWTPAFVLPLSKGLAPNLVVPIGWYQPGRELDLKLQNEQFRVRLDDMVERGNDYHRVSFSAIGRG